MEQKSPFGSAINPVGASLSPSSTPSSSPFGSAINPVGAATLPVGNSPYGSAINPVGSTPQDVQNAQSKLGSEDYTGYCETFQEQMTHSPNMGGTASEAWDNYAKQGRAVGGLQNARQGDKIYFSGDSGMGHTGIISGHDAHGNLTFISATDNGVQNLPVKDWLATTGQQLLGIVPH